MPPTSLDTSAGLTYVSFVYATSGNTSTPVLIRSYPSTRDSSSLYRKTNIWEAARAASAAATFFEPICIGSTGRSFGDSGTGANNPIDEMWKEAIDICEGESLTDNLGCIVSIGTGVPNLKKFGNTAKEVVESIVRIATQTEETANNFHHAHPELNARLQRYFRFNAPRGLEEIELDEASEAGTIEDMTAYYLRDDNTHKQVQQCAKLIAERNSGSSSRVGGSMILLG
jgi:predicted acylesterase/phospholipase RssA